VDTTVGEQGTSDFGVFRTTHFGLDSEVLLGALAVARPSVELAEAEVAVGDEGAHAELTGEREAAAVVVLGDPQPRGTGHTRGRGEYGPCPGFTLPSSRPTASPHYR
jgi:hypothetical protein